MRVGVFGGTFDPIHVGHLGAARALERRFSFDRLLFVPAFSPPHKRDRHITNACHRFAMVALAVANRDDWQLSTIEIDAPERPYTVDTVARLTAAAPGSAPLYFVMGADSFEDLPTWHEYLRLVESCHIIVAARPGHPFDLASVPGDLARRIVDLRGTPPDAGVGAVESGGGAETRVYLTEDVAVDVSSTAVRDAARRGESFAGLVPPAVAAYIEKQELYGVENE